MTDEKIIIEADENQDEDSGAKKTSRVLVFSLGGENYCAGITQIKSVAKISMITRVPNTPDFVVGVMNLRGQILSLLDIRRFFGLPDKKINESSRVIVTDVTGSPVGILADAVKQAIDVDEALIQPPLATVSERLTAYTKGQVQMEKDILVILDLEKVLRAEEITVLKKGE